MNATEQLDQLKAALAERYTLGRVLGHGGMATVYAAEDLRHSRPVAIKVLDPELGVILGKERFLTEIRVMASLQHPHLLPLFDSGEADGQLFYVMPFVEGESLRERLRREKQLPVDEALRIACVIGGALDYAHRHGIVHRDLKPENILFQEGQPLVADFGIALAVTRAGGPRITQSGLSLGTPQYMSPEQATGDRAIDGRTDVYALGALLYEMLTGDPPHTGSTAQAVIAKVLTERPHSVRLCRPSVPAHVEAAVERALAKMPADRFATALELVDALRTPAPVAVPAGIATPGSITDRSADSLVRRPRWRNLVPWGVAAAATVLAAALTVRRPPAVPAKVVRFVLTPGDSARPRTADGTTVALSPDGSRLVYAGGPESGGQLFVRDLGALESRPIRGTERGRTPVFSPDGRTLLFIADGRLKRIDVEGGTAVTVADSAASPSWGEGGILFARSRSLYWVSPSGGPERRIASPDTAHHVWRVSWPSLLPGGRAALVTLATSKIGIGTNAHIGVVRLADGSVTDLGVVGVGARYLPTGHIVYAVLEGVVYGMAFDAERLRVSGPAVPLLDDVRVRNSGAVELAVSHDGTMVYRTGRITRRLLLVDRRGVGTTLLADPRDYAFPALSPDGKRLAVTIGTSSATSDTWIFDTQTGALTRLTQAGGERPEWTADGRSVITVRQDSSVHVIAQPWDGSGAPTTYMDGRDAMRGIWEVSLPRQNAGFMAVRVNAGGSRDISIAPVDSPSALRPFVATDADEFAPTVSPDGRWLGYISNESGRYELYVRGMPGPGPRVQVSTNGAIEPLWSPTGRELFYRADGKIVAARITWHDGTPSVEREALFDDVYGSNANAHVTYSVMPDGNHFVFTQPTDGDSKTIVVLDWFTEVRQRMASADAR